MVRSLGLLGVIVALTLVFVPGLLHPSKSQRFPTATYSDQAAGFRQVTGRPALTPSPLPSGWHANAASLTHKAHAAHFHVGFVTPDGKYVGVDEGYAEPPTFVRSVLGKRGLAVTGSTPIAGATWSTRTSAVGEPAFTRVVRGVTVVVTGSASTVQLRELMTVLHG
jgi:hypothetical protein